MKRILFISAFEPSKRTGGQTFSLRLIETLKERYEIDLYYFTNEKLYNGLKYGTRISQSILVNKLRKFRNFLFFPFFHPFFGARFSWFWLFRFLKLDRKNKYDLIYFDFSQTHLYSLFFDPKRCLLMAHDVIWQKYQREGGIKRFQKKWIYISESIILKKKPNIFTFSEKDCLLIKEKYKHVALPHHSLLIR